MTASGAYPDLARDLARTFGFRLEDLEANRAGRLARRQVLSLLLAEAAFAALTLVFPIGFLLNLLLVRRADTSGLWITFLCAGLPLFVVGALTLWQARRFLADVLARRVAAHVGQARKATHTRIIRSREEQRYTVRFDEQVFELPRAAYESLAPGRVYRAYALPRSGKLISVEPIG
ncbi:MAG: hypothetical protein IT317_20705 [Anaerolineales bacterium]|nr:hypothetical protein [Anaerolineales bacterium]